MNRAPKPRVMFERLLKILKLEESVFVSKAVWTSGRTKIPAHMTRGLTLSIQTGMGPPGQRIQVATHSGIGTGEGSILYSCGAREFAEKVWAIEAGIATAKQLGVYTGDL